MEYHIDPFGNKIFVGTRLFVSRIPRKDGKFRCEYLFGISGRRIGKILTKDKIEAERAKGIEILSGVF